MILCLTLLTLQTPAARAAPVARVDWPVFLARHDLVWDRLPTRWGESAFIGNGRLGATIDAPGGVLGWTINRTTSCPANHGSRSGGVGWRRPERGRGANRRLRCGTAGRAGRSPRA